MSKIKITKRTAEQSITSMKAELYSAQRVYDALGWAALDTKGGRRLGVRIDELRKAIDELDRKLSKFDEI